MYKRDVGTTRLILMLNCMAMNAVAETREKSGV